MKFVVGMVVVFWLQIQIVTAFASWEKASKTKIPTAVEARCQFILYLYLVVRLL